MYTYLIIDLHNQHLFAGNKVGESQTELRPSWWFILKIQVFEIQRIRTDLHSLKTNIVPKK